MSRPGRSGRAGAIVAVPPLLRARRRRGGARAALPGVASLWILRGWSAWPRSGRVGLGILLLAVLAVGVFLSTGWRMFVIESPSMGRAAPVGTLVVDRPVPAAGLQVGDVITYHPPDLPRQTFTHRVVSLEATGIRAKGDLNGAADPWFIPERNVVGEAVLLVPAAGWLLRLVPATGAGIAILWILCAFIPSATWRSATRMLGISLLVSAAFAVFRPLANTLVLDSATAGRHVHADVVATGILPVRLQTTGGAIVDLASGQIGRLTLPLDPSKRYTFATALHLDPLGWCLLGTAWLLPLLWVLVRGLPIDPVVDGHATV